jgi:hypothetical protein
MAFGKLGAMGRGFGTFGALGRASGGVAPPPAWLGTADIGLNYTTQQYYVRGTGYVALSALKTFTRSGSTTTMDSTGAVATFAADTPAAADTGLWDTWEGRQNLLLNTGDLNNASWATFQNNTGTISKVANAATAPDGSNNATKFTINRTTATASYAQVNQSFTGTAAGYSGSVWLKAATGGDIGRVVHLALSNGTAPVNVIQVTLTSAWVRYSVANSTLAASAGCQIIIGYIPTNSGGGSQVGATAFYAWGGQAELGATVSPYMPNAGSSVARGAATWTATGALATLLARATASAEFVTYGADRASVAKTLIDANGTVLLGATSGNLATSAVGATLNTTNNAVWTTTNDIGFSWDASGGLFNLIGTQTSDATARTPTGPFKFFQTGGANFWNGQIGIELYWNTKQTSLQAVLPSGVIPGFINKYAGSQLPTTAQWRFFNPNPAGGGLGALAQVNSGNPLFLQNQNAFDTHGTNTPYMREQLKISSTYYALTSTATGAGTAQDWLYLQLYTSTDRFTWTLNGTNPAITNTAGATTDDHYLLHPATTRDCTLANWCTYYSAIGSDNNWRIFLATSSDGITYSKVGAVITPDSGHGVPNPGLPSIITVGSTLYMYVVNNGNASQNIQVYSSPTTDGQVWTRVGTVLAAPVAGDWDFGATGILDPWVIKNKHGFYEMTYTGYFGSVQYIGYAVADNALGPFYKYSTGAILGPQHLVFVGDPVFHEGTNTFDMLVVEDAPSVPTSQPYGYTLPPY